MLTQIQNPNHPHRVLILTPVGADASNCFAVVTQQGIESTICADLPELVGQISAGAGALLIAEEGLTGSLSTFKSVLSDQAPWSDLPIILLASDKSKNTNSLADQISALGSVTILERPLRRRNLISSIHAALRARARQYEVFHMLKQRDNFLAMLGHELRNPLSPIRNGLHVLKKSINDPQSERVHSMMERQTSHLSRMVDDLLDVGRVINGLIKLQKAPTNLSEIARNVIEDQRSSFDKKGLELKLEGAGEDVWILGDATRITQILTNLLVNALKFTDNGCVCICLETSDITATINITDTGVGIAPSRIGRLFDIFYQADETLARTRGGLGLGLSLCKSLVSLHGGSIVAMSSGEDRGSTFVVTFPRHANDDARCASVSERKQDRKGRILIVEDNIDVAESLQLVLKGMGYDVDVSFDGASGIAAALENRPEVVICDIGLPGNISGLDVARRLKLESSARLVALSGYGLPSDVKASYEAGFVKHLIKPVDISSLVDAIYE